MTTSTGFEFTISEEALTDMELLENLTAIEEGGKDAIAAMPKLFTSLLGKEQKKALYDHVRTEEGRVPIEALTRELGDIFNSFNDNKKK